MPPEPDCSQYRQSKVISADCHSSDTSPVPPAQVIRPQHLRGTQVEAASRGQAIKQISVRRDIKKNLFCHVYFDFLMHIIGGVPVSHTCVFPILVFATASKLFFLLIAGGSRPHESQEDTGSVPHVHQHLHSELSRIKNHQNKSNLDLARIKWFSCHH